MKMRKTATMLMAMAAMTACASSQQKVLVLYYSQTGATKAVAENLAASLGADIEAFDVVEPYDGDFQETIQRCMVERNGNILSPVKPLKVDVSSYDTIFLGFPVWFGVAARPVLSLVDSLKFEGKKVVPFCTFGSGGLESSTDDLKALLPDAEFIEGYGVRNARIAKAPAEIEKYLIAAGLKEGEAEVLPEFSEERPVTEEDAAVFDAACGSYEMPLGSPVSVSERTVQGGTEYKFTAESLDMTGQSVRSTILVLSLSGETPEFTKVIR